MSRETSHGSRTTPEIRHTGSSSSNGPQHRTLLPPPDEWDGSSQRYACGTRDCENTVLLPEHPTEGPITVRAPCPDHGSVRHVALGRSTVRDFEEAER